MMTVVVSVFLISKLRSRLPTAWAIENVHDIIELSLDRPRLFGYFGSSRYMLRSIYGTLLTSFYLIFLKIYKMTWKKHVPDLDDHRKSDSQRDQKEANCRFEKNIESKSPNHENKH